jgi:hypothetical protein
MLLSKILTRILILIFFFACSEKSGHGHGIPKTHFHDPIEIGMQGIYRGVLKSVNPLAAPKLGGSVTLVREKDDFIVDVRVSHGPQSVLQTQTLHEGTRCPDQNDDENKDGYIDAQEAFSAHGGVLIPLDDDLSSLRMGLGIFPVTDEFGFYFWSRSVSFDKLLTDLHEEDINGDDDFVKLPRNKSFQPSGLIVIIRGVAADENLPPTLRGRGRQDPQQSLPVGCAVISKVTSVPGVIDRDETELAVPGGETVGGSSGGDDGVDFPQTQEGTSTGNYGEDDEDREVRGNRTEFDHTSGGMPGHLTLSDSHRYHDPIIP